MKKNFDRNARLYELWKNGHTIDEAFMVTEIPRSTIGYYFKKFKKHEKKGNIADFMDFGKKINSKKEQDDKMDSINTKTTAQIIILKAMKRAGDTGDWMTAYYSIKTLELIMNLKNRYLFTDEELQIIKDTFKPDHDSIKSKDTTSETIERGESLEEIFGSAKKKRLNLFDGLEI